MQRSSIKDIVASVFTIIGVIVFTLTLFYALHFSPAGGSSYTASFASAVSQIVKLPESPSISKANAVATQKKPIPKNYPATLRIPSISLKASVQHVGVTASGYMAVPSNFSDVGWYRGGVIPGGIGTAVIDGHLDNSLGLPAVFGHLADVKLGDEVTVTTHGGKVLQFEVTDSEVYDYDDPAAADAIFSQSSERLIRLVTCDGDWLPSEHIYNKRLVVTAKLVS
jgi:LPXTG-site transpeptidase (sortase) family protein